RWHSVSPLPSASSRDCTRRIEPLRSAQSTLFAMSESERQINMTNQPTGAPDGAHSTGEFDSGAIAKPEMDVRGPGGVAGDGDGFEVLFGDELFGDEKEEWTEHTKQRAFRASWLFTALSALLLVLGGIWLGAFLQRQHSSSTSSASSAFSGLFGSGPPGAI